MSVRQPGEASLLHAIDLALVQDWNEAKSLAESLDGPVANRLFLLLAEIEDREAGRAQQLANVRHEIGNALSIARANLEGIIDGLLEPTEDRLNSLLAALGSASAMLDDLRRPVHQRSSDVVRMEPFDIAALIEAHVAAVAELANAKNVTISYAWSHKNAHSVSYNGDPSRVGRILRDVLLNCIRYTPPNGEINVRCEADDRTLRLYIHNHHAHSELPFLNKLLKSIGAHARLDQHEGDGRNVLAIDLPVHVHQP